MNYQNLNFLNRFIPLNPCKFQVILNLWKIKIKLNQKKTFQFFKKTELKVSQ